MSDQTEYKNIFKSTFLFGFVQIFNILIKVITNKAVAIFLGPEGLGIIGLFNSAINLLKTGAGFGISLSAVRDISEAHESREIKRFSKIVSLSVKVIQFTSLFGVAITIILSPLLSNLVFGNRDYIFSFIWLSLAVGINILTEGQLAILKGMRQLGALAKASIIGSAIGLATALPFYYFFNKSGIVPSLIISAISSLVLSYYFVRKIKFEYTYYTIKNAIKTASPMIKMGMSLMFVSLLTFLSDLIISSYISNHGGLKNVGYYQAGATIISSYFGIVITAMSTDYYPRISAIHTNNIKLNEAVNKQSEIGLILVFPLVVLFLFISPLLIKILYTNEFIQTIEYTDYAILGAVIIICSNSMGMILLAKQKSKIFIYTSTSQRIVMIIMSILAYSFYGLIGLGISYLIMAIIHLALMSILMKIFYDIKFSNRLYKQLLLVLFVAILSLFAKNIQNPYSKYFIGGILLVASSAYSYIIMQRNMNINFAQFLKRKK